MLFFIIKFLLPIGVIVTKMIIATLSFFIFSSLQAVELPEWATPLAYEQIGSCAEGNLGYNASRFTNINLQKTRDEYDVYLQLIVYLKNDGTAYLRTQEVGLVQCDSTPEGDVCTHWPFSDTRKFLVTSWEVNGDSINILNVGQLTKIRDDFPWLGYQIKMSEKFSILEARNAESIGGKVQVNFNEYGINTVWTCKQ